MSNIKSIQTTLLDSIKLLNILKNICKVSSSLIPESLAMIIL